MGRTSKFWRCGKLRSLLVVVLAVVVVVRGQCAEPGAESKTATASAADVDCVTARPPASEEELRRWLQWMVWDYRFTLPEIQRATGLSSVEVREALQRFKIDERVGRQRQREGDGLRLLPYPGGRHPRIGFLDGAIDPHRETKAGVFLPWDPESYVVLDVPEAVFSNLGVLYLAHTHVPTIWDEQGVTLAALEWEQQERGVLAIERTFPNGIAFRTRLTPRSDSVLIEMWLENGSDEPLNGLRSQWCTLLARAAGFTQQSNDNKLFWRNYAACHDADGTRWVIVAAVPSTNAWANPPPPCLHADPQFPDCHPGERVAARGWLSFYEGTEIVGELERIEASGWHRAEANTP